MEENNNNNKSVRNMSIIKIILCLISLIFVIIGWLGLIPKVVGIVAASVFLIAVSLWNAVDAIKEGKKASAILKFVMCGILAAICVIVIFF